MKLLLSGFVALALTQAATPQTILNSLLDADRTFAAAAAKTTLVSALGAMFHNDVVMPTPVPEPGFARGKAQAIAALQANPANADAKVEWRPMRGGISADGQHGFTVGYMTVTSGEGKPQPVKYVAYWVKDGEAWRVAVYKRVLADQPPSTREMLPAALPAQLEPPRTDGAAMLKIRATLEAAEKAFSDEAQKIGLGPAFAKHGSADAVNVGPRSSGTFVVGAEAIGKAVGAGSEGKPSPVSWAADEGAIVASSGDLGVTFGYIRQNAPKVEGPGAVPFITIWRRPNPNAAWQYVAE